MFILSLLCCMFTMGGIAVMADGTGTDGGNVPTEPPAEPPVGIDGIVSAFVQYEAEEIEINATKQVYYCILKKGDITSVKPAELIPAVKNGTFERYYIDISTIGSAKDAYIGLATTLTPGTDGLVPVMTLKIKGTQKKVEINLNWGAEGDEAEGYGLISSIIVTNADNSVETYDNSGENSDKVKKLTGLAVQWRKGTNGDWKDISELSNVKWEIMKNSGATVFFRLKAINQTAQKEGQRYSKEVKLKLNATKAPNVKLDAAKLTLSLKNGMQFRIAGGKSDTWKTVLPVTADGKSETALRDTAKKQTFDPYTEGTKQKIAYMLLDSVLKAVGADAPEGAGTVDIEFRIAATTKKPASRSAIVSIPSQAAGPAVKITAGEKGYTVDSITKAAEDLTENASFEYSLAIKEDVSGGKLDPAAIKWTALKTGTLLKDATKVSYTLSDGTKRTIGITEKNVVILVRRKGINGSGKKPTILASRYTSTDIPEKAAPATTPAPVPETPAA